MNYTQPTRAALATNAPADLPDRRTVRQVMRPPTTTIDRSAHLAGAVYLLKHSHDPALVVTTEGTHEPVGMVTDAEITRAVTEGQDLEDTRIGHVVRQKPLTVDADLSVANAARLMRSEGVQRLPVVERGRLVGVVDLADLHPAEPETRTARGVTRVEE